MADSEIPVVSLFSRLINLSFDEKLADQAAQKYTIVANLDPAIAWINENDSKIKATPGRDEPSDENKNKALQPTNKSNYIGTIVKSEMNKFEFPYQCIKPDEKWNCKPCTFINESTANSCEICENRRYDYDTMYDKAWKTVLSYNDDKLTHIPQWHQCSTCGQWRTVSVPTAIISTYTAPPKWLCPNGTCSDTFKEPNEETHSKFEIFALSIQQCFTFMKANNGANSENVKKLEDEMRYYETYFQKLRSSNTMEIDENNANNVPPSIPKKVTKKQQKRKQSENVRFMNSYHVNKAFKCHVEKCGKLCSTKAGMKQHWKTKHSNGRERERDRDKARANVWKGLLCDFEIDLSFSFIAAKEMDLREKIAKRLKMNALARSAALDDFSSNLLRKLAAGVNDKCTVVLSAKCEHDQYREKYNGMIEKCIQSNRRKAVYVIDMKDTDKIKIFLFPPIKNCDSKLVNEVQEFWKCSLPKTNDLWALMNVYT